MPDLAVSNDTEIIAKVQKTAEILMIFGTDSSQHNTMKPKRRHKTLTIEDKIFYWTTCRLVSYLVLCERYGVGRGTISDLKKKEPKLRQFKKKITELGAKRSTTMKSCSFEDLETALFVNPNNSQIRTRLC